MSRRFLRLALLQLCLSNSALALVPLTSLHISTLRRVQSQCYHSTSTRTVRHATSTDMKSLASPTEGIANAARRLKTVKSLFPTARRPAIENGNRYRSDDWIRSFLSTPQSYVLGRIKFHLTVNTVLCGLILAAHRQSITVSIPMVGHSLLGSFLGLLLVFRTNSAYARFWEARGVWSSVLAKCRSLAFDEVAYLRSHSPKSAAKFADLLAAFPDALAHRCLCGASTLPPNIQALVKNKNDTATSLEPAAVICMKMHAAMASAAAESPTSGTNYLEALHLSSMTHGINTLADTLASCEKIIQTPVPLSYSRHTSRFLTIWCGMLPFAIVEPLGLLAVPVMAVVCWLLFGIEEIGHLIEQPFVQVVAPGSAAAEDIECDRAKKTSPYDIGLPVCTLAGQIRAEVKRITASQVSSAAAAH